MTGRVIAISGFAGVGKSTLSLYVVERYGFKDLSFAAKLKQIVQDVYDFTDDQMYGPSEFRDAPDMRYPRGDGTYLTPRMALERFGTEGGRYCYRNTWCDAAMKMAKAYASGSGFAGVVFSDSRFVNEFEAVRKDGGLVIRLVRSGIVCGDHESETEQAALPDSYFDAVFSTDGTKAETQQLFSDWYKVKVAG